MKKVFGTAAVVAAVRWIAFGLIDSAGRMNVDISSDGGAQGTGINPPAGGTGILGFLSGIYKSLSGSGVIGEKASTLAPVTGNITAAGQAVTATALDGYDGMTFQVSGVYNAGATLQFEVSADQGTTWVSIMASRVDNATGGISVAPGANASLLYTTYLSGCTQFRVRCSAWAGPTGTINIILVPFASSEEPSPMAILTTSTGNVVGTWSTGDGAGGPSNPLGMVVLGKLFNGATYDTVRPLSAAGDGLGVQLATQPSSNPVSQSATHAANTVTIAAAASQRNRITHLSGSVSGSGTMPTAAAPATLTLKDGVTVIAAWDITTSGKFDIAIPQGGIKGSVNTAMTVAFADLGANVTSTINTASLTA